MYIHSHTKNLVLSSSASKRDACIYTHIYTYTCVHTHTCKHFRRLQVHVYVYIYRHTTIWTNHTKGRISNNSRHTKKNIRALIVSISMRDTCTHTRVCASMTEQWCYVYTRIYTLTYPYTFAYTCTHKGWLRVVGSLKL